ncbi:MAG: DUF4397 domain-containing protein, partial [Kangiellaceae bacterium]|nr:DUF4397 domain-containing protein [Kangiellaceae bacterium]
MKNFSVWLFLIFFVLIGCSDDNAPVVEQPGPVATTKLQIVHASPDAPLVDLVLDGSGVAENVDYKQATAITEITAGSHTAAVRAILPDESTIDAFAPVTADLQADTI